MVAGLCCCCWVWHFLTSKVISVASDIEREKSDKFCSEALISAWGSVTCRKSTTPNPQLYFHSEGSHTQDFYALKKIHRPRRGSNPRISDPEASMIITGPPESREEFVDTEHNHRELSNFCIFIISLREFNLSLTGSFTWLTTPGPYRATTCRGREFIFISHTYFLTTQGHGEPPRLRDQLNAGATSETAQTWKTIHIRHTLTHSFQQGENAVMSMKSKDIRGPCGPKVSWYLSYRWGKTP